VSAGLTLFVTSANAPSLQDVINSWRRTLDLEPVPFSEGPLLAETLEIPVTYCWSPALVPKPADWPSYIGTCAKPAPWAAADDADVCGFFFRKEPEYAPTPELAGFLKSGQRPVYIGFGSIVVDDPRALSATIAAAVKEAGVRAVVSRGWSKLGEGQVPSTDVFYLDDCPHEWLFKQVSAVVHHGGAGTTACGLLNGRPTVVVPFFGE